jgi:hypothetical protein
MEGVTGWPCGRGTGPVLVDLFQYGLDHGHLLFERRGQGRMRIPLDWQLPALVQRGKDKQRPA